MPSVKNDKTEKTNIELENKAKAVKTASKRLAYIGTPVKNQALKNIAADLIAKCDEILAANKIDYTEAEASGMNTAMLDRLLLTKDRLQGIANDVLTVASLPDPVGEVMEMRTLDNGDDREKARTAGCHRRIYETAPTLRSISPACVSNPGNGCILRGGKEQFILTGSAKVIQDAIKGPDSLTALSRLSIPTARWLTSC